MQEMAGMLGAFIMHPRQAYRTHCDKDFLIHLQDYAVLPNSTIAKSKIVNVSSPSRIRGTTLTVAIDGRSPPSAAVEVLEQAFVNCSSILATPPASVAITTWSQIVQ